MIINLPFEEVEKLPENIQKEICTRALVVAFEYAEGMVCPCCGAVSTKPPYTYHRPFLLYHKADCPVKLLEKLFR